MHEKLMKPECRPCREGRTTRREKALPGGLCRTRKARSQTCKICASRAILGASLDGCRRMVKPKALVASYHDTDKATRASKKNKEKREEEND